MALISRLQVAAAVNKRKRQLKGFPAVYDALFLSGTKIPERTRDNPQAGIPGVVSRENRGPPMPCWPLGIWPQPDIVIVAEKRMKSRRTGSIEFAECHQLVMDPMRQAQTRELLSP